jgi:hypothetical protein
MMLWIFRLLKDLWEMRLNYWSLFLNKVETLLKALELFSYWLHLILVTILQSFSSFSWFHSITGVCSGRMLLRSLLASVRKRILSSDLIAALSAVYLDILMSEINWADVGISNRNESVFISFLPLTVSTHGTTKYHLMLFMRPTYCASVRHNIIPGVSFTMICISIHLVLALKHYSLILLKWSQHNSWWLH